MKSSEENTMTLKDLQLRIIKHNIDAYIVTRNNMFIGQDILGEENPLKSLVGFTGSSGKLLVFHDRVVLFVDGRYELQAKQEVHEDIEIVISDKGSFNKWLMEAPQEYKKLKIGFNPWHHTINEIENLRTSFSNVNFIESEIFFLPLSSKQSIVFEHSVEFSGISRKEKIYSIAPSPLTGEGWGGGVKHKAKSPESAYFISAADSISWLLNIRSNCLPNTPIVRAMALIDSNKNITLFGDNLDFELNFEENIKVLPFSAIEKELAKFKKKKVLFCFHQTPQKIKNFADKHKLIYHSSIDPCQVAKAEKNPVEIANIQKSHLRDGIVLSKFLCWLNKNAAGLTELDIVKNLYDFRKIQENFFSNSFDTIAGFGSNGAIVHYHPTEETNKTLENGSLLLLDSGAQYLDGTTDVTRTIAIGEPKPEMIQDFTTVLKAHISLASTVFTKRNGGIKLDIIARKELWKQHKDYAHGTGHGVGYFLNVHEGPNSISANGTYYNLKENMITSIEPGFYKEGEYGIRIENLYLICEDNDFLAFEPLTLVPIDKRLINSSLLTWEEKKWLNNYHQKVFEKLEPYMEEEEKKWLKTSCEPV